MESFWLCEGEKDESREKIFEIGMRSYLQWHLWDKKICILNWQGQYFTLSHFLSSHEKI